VLIGAAAARAGRRNIRQRCGSFRAANRSSACVSFLTSERRARASLIVQSELPQWCGHPFTARQDRLENWHVLQELAGII
jgi:hypothetical protein